MAEEKAQPSLRQAVTDFGFFWWLFGVIVGTPSVISLYQMVFVEHRLGALPQALIDGYNQALGLFGVMIEPWLLPALHWLGSLIAWEPTLYPHWRALFVLMMIMGGAVVRMTWREGERWPALAGLVFFGLGSLAGSVAAGLVPLGGGWWAQGLIAALPWSVMGFLAFIWIAPNDVATGDFIGAGAVLRDGAMVFGRLCLVIFLLAAGLLLIPGFAQSAGLLTVGGIVVFLAVLATFLSMFDDGEADPDDRLFVHRTGLTMLGPFVGAGLVYGLDAALKAWG